MASVGLATRRVAGAPGPSLRIGRCPGADTHRLGRTGRSVPGASSLNRGSAAARGRRLQATGHRSPWDTLGVERDASVPDVKRAYRRLVLRYHPDVSPDSEPEEKFLELHDAYMTMIGKTKSGRDPSAPPRDSGSWEFHDWYWSFSTNQRRRRSSSTSGYSKRPEAEKAASRSQVQQQLSHLKARARSRRSRSPASPRSPTAAATAGVASPEAAATASHYDPEEDDPWADPSLSVDNATGEEVHPAWRASVGGSSAEDGDAGGAAAAAEGANEASGPYSLQHHQKQKQHQHQQKKAREEEEEEPHKPHVYSHRPPGMSSSHLGSQLSGLKRRAGLKNRTTGAMAVSS